MIVTRLRHEPTHKTVWDVCPNGNVFPGLTVWDVHKNGNIFLGLTVCDIHMNGNVFPGLTTWDCRIESMSRGGVIRQLDQIKA